MNKAKAVSYHKDGKVLGELVFEDFTPFEAALAVQKDFSLNGLDSEVIGGLREDDEYKVVLCYTGIEVKIFPLFA